MRDLVVREALQTMAGDASERLRELVAGGEEIPYEVEEPTSASPLPRYVPLTWRFIQKHAPALLQADSFGAGCAAIESAGLTAPYLERLGVTVPDDERRRGELGGITFLCRLWEGSTDFSVETSRVADAVAELQEAGEATDDEIEVVVPLRGLQLPIARLELATATIVRADTVEVPVEARSSDAVGGAGWEPAFLAAARVVADQDEAPGPEPTPDAGARAVEAFRQLITALRLFKPGGVGLGPYAWTRVGTDRWRRIATGAGRPRPGGYRLAAEELGDLIALTRTLAYRSSAFGRPADGERGAPPAIGRAISRFEAGLERGLVLEALNDYLLSLRFLLEGGGPAGLELSMRVSALCAEPDERAELRALVDRALSLERELWSGEPARSPEGALSPGDTAASVEDLARGILKDAACGHLGRDLRSTADEILLADGFAVGEGGAEHRGGNEEWDLSEGPGLQVDGESVELADVDEELNGGEAGRFDDETRELSHLGAAESEPLADEAPVAEHTPAPVAPDEVATPGLWAGLADWGPPGHVDQPEADVQVPDPQPRIRMEPRPRPQELTMNQHALEAPARLDSLRSEPAPEPDPIETRPDSRETVDRVAYLFPRPETTEWHVDELSYDRRRRARTRAS